MAQNFVSDRNTPEAITVGLNTIREIYANCPAAATEDMVRDLAEVCEKNFTNSFFELGLDRKKKDKMHYFDG